jgi:hypothetical protein
MIMTLLCIGLPPYPSINVPPTRAFVCAKEEVLEKNRPIIKKGKNNFMIN